VAGRSREDTASDFDDYFEYSAGNLTDGLAGRSNQVRHFPEHFARCVKGLTSHATAVLHEVGVVPENIQQEAPPVTLESSVE
jgi:hypothetical protein